MIATAPAAPRRASASAIQPHGVPPLSVEVGSTATVWVPFVSVLVVWGEVGGEVTVTVSTVVVVSVRVVVGACAFVSGGAPVVVSGRVGIVGSAGTVGTVGTVSSGRVMVGCGSAPLGTWPEKAGRPFPPPQPPRR